MARAGLDLDIVLQAAIKIADAEGLEVLTIAKLAAVLGVKPPSLYKHIKSLDMLRGALTAEGLQAMLDRSRDSMAGVAGSDALDALGHTQRQFAQEHPGLWAAAQLPVRSWNKDSKKAAEAYLALALSLMRGYGTTGDAAIHAIRLIRSSLRGFIDLEIGGGFGLPQDLDVSFRTLLKMLDTALRVKHPQARVKKR